MQKIFNQELRFKDENEEYYPTWNEIYLNEISKIKTGSKNVEDNVADGKYHFFDRSMEIKFLNEYSFDEEAIIYPGEGSSFSPKFFVGKYALHQRAYSIANFNEEINSKFLYYQLCLKGNHFLKYAVGSTVKSLRMNSFEKCLIVCPSVEEQNKISHFLSNLDRRIQKEQEKILTLQEQKKGFMQQMFI